jgi:GT2 family glycosyltransferase
VLEEIVPRSLVVVVNDPRNAPEPALDWLSANAGVLVLNEVARGYGANVNEAARRLQGRCRYYLVANDDVQPARGSIAALRSSLENDSRAAVAAPQLVDGDGVPQPVAYRFPSVGSEVASALILPGALMGRLWQRSVLGDAAASFWVAGAIMLVRAAAFDEVGGFDEEFFLYSEETDLILRMRERGWSAVVCDDAVAVHLGAESTSGRDYRRLMAFSRRKYIQKHWPLRDRLALLALLPLVHVWNSLYVLGRIVFEPRSVRAKLALWTAHWDNRPGPRLRGTWRRADV